MNDSVNKIRREGSPLTLHFDPVVQEGVDFALTPRWFYG